MRNVNQKKRWGIVVLSLAILFLQGCNTRSSSSSEPDSTCSTSIVSDGNESSAIESQSVTSMIGSSVSVGSHAVESSKSVSKKPAESSSNSKSSLSQIPQSGEKDPMEILIIGDSNTEGGNITNPMKDILEEKYGYTGSGYTSLNENFPTPKRNGLKVVNDIHWKKFDMVTYLARLSTPYEAGQGMWITSAEKGATTLANFRGSAVDVYYLGKPDGGSFVIEIDQVQKIVVNTAADTRGSKKATVSGLSDSTLHNMRLIVKEGSVSLQGFDAKIGNPRGVVHSWGNSSAATTDFLKVDEAVFCSDLYVLNPNYVVIMIGTNDHFVDQLSSIQFKSNLITLIQRVQKALPKTKILLVSTFQTNTPEVKTLLKEYLSSSYPQAAKGTGVAYWDMSSWFGTYRKSSMLDDYHCNEESGKKVAVELWNQIQNYNTVLKNTK